MSTAALVFAFSLAFVFIAALILDFYETRRDWREWREEHPAQDGDDPWAP